MLPAAAGPGDIQAVVQDTLVEVVGNQAAEVGIQPEEVAAGVGSLLAGVAAQQRKGVAVELDRLAGGVAAGEGKAQSGDRERAESQQEPEGRLDSELVDKHPKDKIRDYYTIYCRNHSDKPW